jgi:CDP-diacylglycerol--glycerol-3-phosphate 3-phosphatidyltransferase
MGENKNLEPKAENNPQITASSAHEPVAELPQDTPKKKPKRGLPLLRGRFARDKESKKIKKRRMRKLQIRPPTNFKQEMFTIPNILTYMRIAMIPLILLILDRDSRWYSFLAGLLFAIACFTDLLDGYLARKLNQVTILGKLLDPLADKLIVSSVLILMVPMGRVASWLVIIMLAREFAITGLRAIAANEGMVIAADPLGKFKTVFQMLAIFCLLLHYPFQIDYFGLFSFNLNFHRVGTVFLYLALFLSIISALDYFWKFAVAVNSKYKSFQETPS